MIVDFKLPHLGENINNADIIKVHVKAGDKIEVDQIVVEIETDKATVEVPSEVAGLVTKVFVKEGTKAQVGEPVISVEVNGESVQSEGLLTEKTEDVRHETQEARQKVEQVKTEQLTTSNKQLTTNIYEFKIPALGENITSAQITKVLAKPGDKLEADQIILEIETDKATVEVPTEVGGVVKEVKVKEGDKAAIGQVAVVLETTVVRETERKYEVRSAKDEVQVEEKKEHVTFNLQPETKREHTHMPQLVNLPKDIVKTVVPAAPSVRKFAREIGIDVNQVKGSGPNGRISIEDVKSFAKALNEQIQKGIVPTGTVGIPHEALPDFSKWGAIDRQQMSNIRRKTAGHLSYAWTTVPHVTQFDKADITELENLRKQFGKKVETAGGKLTVTSVLLKIIASALKVFPQFNSSVDMEKNEIVYKKFYNIGIAVDTDRGLLVPVVRDVDRKNIIQLSVELAGISKKARDKKLSLEDMQGGSFTISNLGGIGGTYFTPIVNTPEVAILGVSKSSYEPVYIDGKFEPRLMMPLSLSYDHRIIDGADAIRFLRWVVNALENPFLLSLEG
ncbi:MAG: 2-oxo acid dehydrogenase subunit E2 [Ignavibacteriales bacterium]|nr:2-oxo acid dehydrogenase subunit E2 [Ignavibacteriales bacterium]